MYLLYLDETIDKINKVEGLGAVLITDRKCRKFYKELNQLLTKLKIEDFEIHADHIWNGRGSFKNLSMDKRAEISLEIAKLLSASGIARFIYTQESVNGKDKDKMYIESLERLIDVAVKYVKQNAGNTNKQLMLIFDRRDDIKENILEELLVQHQRIVNKHKSSFFFMDCGYEGISKYSRLLQSADFIAYWCRLVQIIQEQPSFFKKADDIKKIKLVKEIESLLKNKLLITKSV
ncbi:DUF3800 domain-containing protein [Patescibacteria group bacterium]|nr:DUF3800 domain-containing protein [Patescibacteria group bacterium]